MAILIGCCSCSIPRRYDRIGHLLFNREYYAFQYGNRPSLYCRYSNGNRLFPERYGGSIRPYSRGDRPKRMEGWRAYQLGIEQHFEPNVEHLAYHIDRVVGHLYLWR